MPSIHASVFILTKNSSATIRRALESVKEFEDIVICDGGSRDGTLEIARAYGARIFSQRTECLNMEGKIIDYSCARNGCVAHATHDWVIYLDSDEEMSRELVEDIRSVVANPHPQHSFWKIPCRIVVDGREMRYSSNYPGYQIRFFNKKSGARFLRRIHERLDFDRGKYTIGTLRGPWRYFISQKNSNFYEDVPQYLSLEAERARHIPLLRRMRISFRALRTASVILLKSLRNYLFHGFQYTMPPELEYSRIRYQLLLARTILFCRIPSRVAAYLKS